MSHHSAAQPLVHVSPRVAPVSQARLNTPMCIPASPLLAALLALAITVPVARSAHPESADQNNQAQQTSAQAILANYSFARASARTRLPKQLRELSGLVATDATSVALHTDNDALVWTFDYSSAKLDPRLRVSAPIPGDFEGIAVVNEHLLLADSHGSISRFEQPPKASTEARTLYHPMFKEHCVFEGLALDPQSATLLLPCKYPRFEAAGKAAANDDLIYIFKLKLDEAQTPHVESGFEIMEIDVTKILQAHYLPRLRPSAIEVVADRLLILAGKERVLLETSLAGELITWRRLHWPRHRQAEGLAIGADGALIIADEGRWLGGTVTVYRPLD